MSLVPSLRRNILYLGWGQLAQLLVPFLALPHLTRNLGVEGFGQMTWVMLIMHLGVLWVDFGFGWSVTREIAAHRADRAKISALTLNTWMAQACLCLLFMGTALLLAVLFAPLEHWVLYASGFTLVLGQALFPLSLFQGMEWMRPMVVFQVLGKLCSLVLILIWVRAPQDLSLAILFSGIAPVVSGLSAILWLSWQRHIQWQAPSWQAMRQLVAQSTLLFLSQGLISTYNLLIPLGVGWWAGSVELAWFNLADRLRKAAQLMLSPIGQALYPRMSWLAQHDPALASAYVSRMMLFLGLPALLAGAGLWFGASLWMAWLGGPEFDGAVPVMRWLAFVPAVVLVSHIAGVQIMLPRRMNRPFTAILILASMTSLLLMRPLIEAGAALSAAQLLLGVETLVSASMVIYLRLRWRFDAVDTRRGG